MAIIGLGPIGNLAVQLARCAGAGHVTGIDPVKWRRSIARECGADHTAASIDELPDSSYDLVIEATGRPDVVPLSFRPARKRGRVVLLGSTRGVTSEVNFYRDVHKKGLTVIGAHESIRPSTDDTPGYCTHETDEIVILKLLSSGRLQLRPLISDTVPADEAQNAYDRLHRGHEDILLITLAWK